MKSKNPQQIPQHSAHLAPAMHAAHTVTRRERRPAPASQAAGTDELGDLKQDLQDLNEPLVQHPDGWYWQSVDGRTEVGPFPDAESARADLHAADEYAPEPGASLAEAEAELGIADWIDPDTGEPAEGQGLPRLGDV